MGQSISQLILQIHINIFQTLHRRKSTGTHSHSALSANDDVLWIFLKNHPEFELDAPPKMNLNFLHLIIMNLNFKPCTQIQTVEYNFSFPNSTKKSLKLNSKTSRKCQIYLFEMQIIMACFSFHVKGLWPCTCTASDLGQVVCTCPVLLRWRKTKESFREHKLHTGFCQRPTLSGKLEWVRGSHAVNMIMFYY